jgi:hypothetical protein
MYSRRLPGHHPASARFNESKTDLFRVRRDFECEGKGAGQRVMADMTAESFFVKL